MTSALEELSTRIRERNALPTPELRRALREAAGATRADVARVCGVSVETVRQWEVGAWTPRGEHLTDYLETLELFRREGVLPETREPDLGRAQGSRDDDVDGER